MKHQKIYIHVLAACVGAVFSASRPSVYKRFGPPTATCANPGERPDPNPWSIRQQKGRKRGKGKL